MNGLHEEFGERMDFIRLNVDNSDHDVVRAELGLAQRSHYVLIDQNGEVIRRWAGPLDPDAIAARCNAILEERGF